MARSHSWRPLVAGGVSGAIEKHALWGKRKTALPGKPAATRLPVKPSKTATRSNSLMAEDASHHPKWHKTAKSSSAGRVARPSHRFHPPPLRFIVCLGGGKPAFSGRIRSSTTRAQPCNCPLAAVPVGPVPHQPIPPYLPNSQNLVAVEMVNRCSSTNSSSGNRSP